MVRIVRPHAGAQTVEERREPKRDSGFAVAPRARPRRIATNVAKRPELLRKREKTWRSTHPQTNYVKSAESGHGRCKNNKYSFPSLANGGFGRYGLIHSERLFVNGHTVLIFDLSRVTFRPLVPDNLERASGVVGF